MWRREGENFELRTSNSKAAAETAALRQQPTHRGRVVKQDREMSPEERLIRIDERVGLLLKASDDQEKRIRVLEWRDAVVFGFSSAIGLAAPFIAKKIFGI
jgi:hypothetical protein